MIDFSILQYQTVETFMGVQEAPVKPMSIPMRRGPVCLVFPKALAAHLQVIRGVKDLQSAETDRIISVCILYSYS